MSRTVDTREIDLLVHRDHPEPHRLLGAHPGDGGVTVRAWRPDAVSARLLPDDGEPVEMERVHEAGLFEARVDHPLGRYRIEATYPDGNAHVTRDGYAFLPTIGELDLHLAGQGRHGELWRKLGAHPRDVNGVPGTAFSVWAPSARSVSIVGDFNGWDGRAHPMRSLGGAGVWELFVPDAEPGGRYKFEIRNQDGSLKLKADPLALAMEHPPATASVIHESDFPWTDADWITRRRRSLPHERPVSVYEVHLASWRLNPLEGNRPLTYLELADELVAYVQEMGFTHVELMPVMEHPYSPSWGYQVSAYFAPTARLGSPDDLRALIDRLHAAGIGVIMDWVPAHFPRDDFALARFDGTALFEHEDPRRGAHPDWGTLIFNYARNEVRGFLIASALFWLQEFHADGLRVDAVASMLYRDYSRAADEWVPNQFGGREDLEAVAFLRELNEVVHAAEPGTLMAAEESTAWPAVTRPTSLGGLGFDFKWNMGWMHDTLDYFQRDPIHRKYHHDRLTFGLIYAFSEQFILPLSHDEVVHGKGSLYGKMPGDRWLKMANLRALYAYMWAHPGKKLLFMGGELAQEAEWSHARSLDWHLLEQGDHAGMQKLVRDLNRAYRAEPALWELDSEPAGFRWLDAEDAAANVLAFLRLAKDERRAMACVCNFSPIPREGHRIGLPSAGRWREVINSDAGVYGGSNAGNAGVVEAEEVPWQGQPFSAVITLPPLAVLWLAPANR